MLFGLIKPTPKFGLEEFLERESTHSPNCRYMIVKKRYFGRLDGEKRKQWLYDGVVVRVRPGRHGDFDEAVAVTKIFSVKESHLSRIAGMEDFQF